MNEKILKYLDQIEKHKEVKIVLACETGSRAWGFPSPDSDYDIRIIYKHKIDWYFSLTEGKDIIELMAENNELDITGWELKKALRLLMKSNASLLERIQSPIIYKSDETFTEGIKEIADECYSRITTIHHYLTMAKRYFEKVKNAQQYKLKDLFYALRAASACNWVLEKENIPPIIFKDILEGIILDSNLKSEIFNLIELKSTADESYLHKGEEVILQYIKDSIEKTEENKNGLPAAKYDIKKMNDFFRKQIN